MRPLMAILALMLPGPAPARPFTLTTTLAEHGGRSTFLALTYWAD